MHFTQDDKIPNDLVDSLYNAAGQPKQVFRIDKAYHGYDNASVREVLEQELAGWV